MIGRKFPRKSEDEAEVANPKGFDDFELRLGDTMRGERATMGKSLLDVQRELRIKAAYIAAIENSDPSAFDTPGFIAGYVRSYARYLGMNPDEAFATFCEESGFAVAHGMSAEASVVKKSKPDDGNARFSGVRDPFTAPSTPFIPGRDGVLSQIEPRAIGSTLILMALIAGIGYGGWSVLKEVQQVQFAPVDQAPVVLSDLDPLENAVRPAQPGERRDGGLTAPSAEALDRLYRPQALDVPVLVARDAPISTLDPETVGTFATPALPEIQIAENILPYEQEFVPQVVETPSPALQIVAVRLSWVRVRSADGTVIFEKTMQPGDTWEAPLTEEPPVLRTGESGAIYFAMNDKFYGPVGDAGSVTSNLPLSIASLQETYLPVEVGADEGLVRYAEAQGLIPAASE
ncbi:helix-turn-helix domain-containing protein [Arenibacterium sp. CAU 1754]